MSIPVLSVDQGAALLWLRQAGGRAGSDRSGHVSFNRAFCPLVFTNFDALESLGLVEMQLADKASGNRLDVLITDEGSKHPIEPDAERRLDELMRRFDD